MFCYSKASVSGVEHFIIVNFIYVSVIAYVRFMKTGFGPTELEFNLCLSSKINLKEHKTNILIEFVKLLQFYYCYYLSLSFKNKIFMLCK